MAPIGGGSVIKQAVLAASLTLLCAGLCTSNAVAADPIEDFYKGRQISLVISTDVGGGYDAVGRMFARHFTNHVPGNPTIVPQNMPGAGGLRATHFLFNNAPHDGTTIGLVHGSMTTADLLSPEGAKFDGDRTSWIGNMAGEPGFCVSWHESPVKSFADIKTHDFTVGSSGAGAGLDFFPKVLNNLFDTKIRIVSGYSGGTAVLLAMERGEVDGICSWPYSGMEKTRPTWLPEHKINLLVQFGLAKNPKAPDVPLILDLVPDEATRAALELMLTERQLLRPILAPPGIPAERLTALRQAFMATMQDPAFLADAAKMSEDITPMSGADVEALIHRLHRAPPDVLQRAIKLKS
jgi:tripartite-type tricarboxylate transporter receptor subunit TctC